MSDRPQAITSEAPIPDSGDNDICPAIFNRAHLREKSNGLGVSSIIFIAHLVQSS